MAIYGSGPSGLASLQIKFTNKEDPNAWDETKRGLAATGRPDKAASEREGQ